MFFLLSTGNSLPSGLCILPGSALDPTLCCFRGVSSLIPNLFLNINTLSMWMKIYFMAPCWDEHFRQLLLTTGYSGFVIGPSSPERLMSKKVNDDGYWWFHNSWPKKKAEWLQLVSPCSLGWTKNKKRFLEVRGGKVKSDHYSLSRWPGHVLDDQGAGVHISLSAISSVTCATGWFGAGMRSIGDQDLDVHGKGQKLICSEVESESLENDVTLVSVYAV